MKFSDIAKNKWDELQPYMDTCLLPLTGLTGSESPWEATEALERLRDAMEEMEKRYVGRIVTYPALHYTTGEEAGPQVARVTASLRSAGFRYIVLITADPATAKRTFPEADLFVTMQQVEEGTVAQAISDMWHQIG